MKESGYSEKFRLEVISSGVAGFEKQLSRAAEGICPLYRPKGYKTEERRRKKLVAKRAWYKPFSTVLFCPPSPNSCLAVELRKVVEQETSGKGWSVKVIERAGVKLQHQLPGLKEPVARMTASSTPPGGRETAGKRGWYTREPVSHVTKGDQVVR